MVSERHPQLKADAENLGIKDAVGRSGSHAHCMCNGFSWTAECEFGRLPIATNGYEASFEILPVC